MGQVSPVSVIMTGRPQDSALDAGWKTTSKVDDSLAMMEGADPPNPWKVKGDVRSG